MLDRYGLDEFPPKERVSILLNSGSHLKKSDLDFLNKEISNINERKRLAKRFLERTDIRLSKGARKLLEDILAQE